MGAISQAIDNRQAAQEQQFSRRDTFVRDLEVSMPRLEDVAGDFITKERLFQIAMSAYNKTPHLAECSNASILSCLMTSVSLGFEPSAVDGLGNCYIIPRRNKQTGYEATFLLGYRGMVALAARSGISVTARIVYAADDFYYQYGIDENLVHVPALENESPMVAVYAVATLPDGTKTFDVMSKSQVDKIRKRSQSGESSYSPWATDYDEMARKTVIRRMFKTLPIGVEANRAVSAEETPVEIDLGTGEVS